MFKLETGMVVRFYDGDIGIVLDGYIMCKNSYLKVVDISENDMIDEIKAIYSHHNLHTLNSILNIENYSEEDILWKSGGKLKEGDVIVFTNLISADVYHVTVNQYYVKTKDGLVMIDKHILPYLKGEVKEIS